MIKLGEAEYSIEGSSSVEYTINAKGAYSGKCKVYHKDVHKALELADEIAQQIENKIALKNASR